MCCRLLFVVVGCWCVVALLCVVVCVGSCCYVLMLFDGCGCRCCCWLVLLVVIVVCRYLLVLAV